MNENIYLVVTSIAAPNEALRALAAGAVENGYKFVVIGDQASPEKFDLDGCDFYSLNRQLEISEFAKICPKHHYARKNIGYLLAMAGGASVIIETDDDNLPYPDFWAKRSLQQTVRLCQNDGWVNVYSYFSDSKIWPRGFPLTGLKTKPQDYELLEQQKADCPIQQYLADDNPDVDAVYRLLFPLPQKFKKAQAVALGKESFCPFNSQNTTWFPSAYKLMYLPAYCSFRMTDIWRSFIAQRIAQENAWPILFAAATMYQQRNEHNLLKDFADEVPGYLNNDKICTELQKLNLKQGSGNIDDNLRICYDKLIEMKLVAAEELKLLEVWLGEVNKIYG